MADDLLHGIKVNATAPTTADRTRPTSLPTSRPTDFKAAAHLHLPPRAALGRPFCWVISGSSRGPRKAPLCGPGGRGSALAVPRRGIVGPLIRERSMAETADDLSTPLGQTTPRRKRRYRCRFTGFPAAGRIARPVPGYLRGLCPFNDNPLAASRSSAWRSAAGRRGRKPAAEPAAAPEHGTKAAAKHETPGEPKTVTIIDGSSGARHDVRSAAGKLRKRPQPGSLRPRPP